MIVQIYEVQTAEEARALVALGVDHIGSVILSPAHWKSPAIREVVRQVQAAGAKSGLIPIFDDPVTISDMLDYYRPDFVHFCEALSPFAADRAESARKCEALLDLQRTVRKMFPDIAVMRSLSVPQAGTTTDGGIMENILNDARKLAEQSDYFLMDTIVGTPSGMGNQPVAGFVGISGKTCDWAMAARIVTESPIPVILAGGIAEDNAFEAALMVKPAGIDSCTRTNAMDEKGQPIRFKKDLAKVRRMVEEIRRAENISKH
jgi:phosphoribosylanthranilate isomerase